jgi:hypothetical protein
LVTSSIAKRYLLTILPKNLWFLRKIWQSLSQSKSGVKPGNNQGLGHQKSQFFQESNVQKLSQLPSKKTKSVYQCVIVQEPKME